MEFVCDLDIPRDERNTYIPTAWIEDDEVDFEARGFLLMLLSYAEPGVVVDEGTVKPRHPNDPPMAFVVEELVRGGYLIAETGDRYRLVHPTRLGAFPG
jgi:hypothetical protein